jgi:hypothetical protein
MNILQSESVFQERNGRDFSCCLRLLPEGKRKVLKKDFTVYRKHVAYRENVSRAKVYNPLDTISSMRSIRNRKQCYDYIRGIQYMRQA